MERGSCTLDKEAAQLNHYRQRIEEHEQLQRLLDEPDTLFGFPIEWKDDMLQLKEGDIVLGDLSCWADDGLE